LLRTTRQERGPNRWIVKRGSRRARDERKKEKKSGKAKIESFTRRHTPERARRAAEEEG